MARLNRADIYSALDKHEKEIGDQDVFWSDPRVANHQPVQKPGMGPALRTTPQGKKVKIWTNSLESSAWKQTLRMAALPIVHPQGIALMPDVHPGKDIPIGSVLPTKDALVPAAVGVDIGCGMIAAMTSLKVSDLPTNLKPIRELIEKFIPVNKGGRHKIIPDIAIKAWKPLENGYNWIAEKHPKSLCKNPMIQMGTLGSGNHFIEICTDGSRNVWIMLHSGSRGIGAAVGRYFIAAANHRVQNEGERSSAGIGWFPKIDPLFADYAKSVQWAQEVARVNREIMLGLVLKALSEALKRNVSLMDQVVSCHHNYVTEECHYNESVWITRKGAISAQKGELGIIPGAMGKESFIVEGLGNKESWCPCSHGAGRLMSRSAAKEKYTVHDLRRQTEGLECKKSRSIVDEIPSAYKALNTVMSHQRDLVKIKHKLKAVICIKE